MIYDGPRAVLSRCDGIRPAWAILSSPPLVCYYILVMQVRDSAFQSQLHLYVIRRLCMNVSPVGLPFLRLRSGVSGNRAPS